MWYKVESPDNCYYTPFGEWKHVHTFIGDGSRMPTPKEYADYLNEKGEHHHVQSGGRITYRVPEPMGDPVELPAGLYTYADSMGSIPERLIPLSARKEAYAKVAGITGEMEQDIKEFLDNEKLYRETGIMYKLGMLLYGPPGCGKSALLRQMIEKAIPEDSVVMFFYQMPSNAFLAEISRTLSSRLKVFIFEELVTLIENSFLSEVLNFLDGERSVDKSIVVATTNYPERLPGNLVDRPSRFDKRYKFGTPKTDDRKTLLEFYLNREVTSEELTCSEGLTAAALKEVAMLSRLKGLTIKEAVKKMKDMSDLVKKDFAELKPVGIYQG